MAGTKMIDKNKIEPSEAELSQAKRRPITSHYRGGDRLPSRASKTRERSRKIHIGTRKSNRRQQQGSTKKSPYVHDSISPKHNRAIDSNVSSSLFLSLTV